MPIPTFAPIRASLLATLVLVSACRAPFEPSDATTPPPSSPGTSPLLPVRVGSLGPDFARSVATDDAGNAWVASYFSGTVDFDPGSGVTARIATGPYDIALTKYAADGSFRWVYAIGGSDADVPFAVKLAPDGAAYLTGYITAGAVCSGRALPNAGDRDIFLMRVSAAGSCDWAIAVGGSGPDEGHDLAVDPNGDVLITGSFSGTVDFNPGTTPAILTSRGGTDGFVARYGADGSFRNVAQFGGAGDDFGNAIAIRPDGDVVIGGAFSGLATFGSVLAPLQLTSLGGLDYLVARFAPALGLEWAARGGGSGNDIVAVGGVIAPSNSTLYVAGTFTGIAGVGPGIGSAVLIGHGDADVFIANYDASGVWSGFARTLGGPGTDGVSSFARDAAGNFYLAGSFQGTVDFDPGSQVHNLTALGTNGAADAFVMSLSPAGDLRWVNPLSATTSGDVNFAIASGVSLAVDGSVWTVGRFFGLVDFDPGAAAVQRQSVGDADQFVVRYDQATGAIRR